ncbi:MAG: hypothetical protein IIA30_12655 [Myxococcales bacterium]|nr:hypothetical protein [Myxococcales bacterium]
MSEREARLKRLEALRQAGVDPYPARVDDRIAVAEVVRRYGDKSEEELEAALETVAICGRVMAKRSFLPGQNVMPIEPRSAPAPTVAISNGSDLLVLIIS